MPGDQLQRSVVWRTRVKGWVSKVPDASDVFNSQSTTLAADALAATVKLIGIVAPVPGMVPAAECLCAILVLCKNVVVNRNAAEALAERCLDVLECVAGAVNAGDEMDDFELAMKNLTDELQKISKDMTEIFQCRKFIESMAKQFVYAKKIRDANGKLDRSMTMFKLKRDLATHKWQKRIESTIKADQEKTMTTLAKIQRVQRRVGQEVVDTKNIALALKEVSEVTLLLRAMIDDMHKGDRRAKGMQETLRFLVTTQAEIAPPMELVYGQVQFLDKPVRTSAPFAISRGIWEEKTVAIKRFWGKSGEYGDIEKNLMRAQREVDIWKRLNDADNGDHFAQMHGCCSTDGDPYVVSEWFEEKEQLSVCTSAKSSRTRAELRIWILGMARSLRKMHEMDPPIMHGDIRPQNVYIRDGKIILSGFGLSKIAEPLRTVEVTQSYWEGDRYRPYEHHQRESGFGSATPTLHIMGLPADIWSLGMTILYVLTGNKPYAACGADSRVTTVYIAGGELPPRPTDDLSRVRGLDDQVWELLKECWRLKPAQRPTIQDLIQKLEAMWPGFAE